jgi:hypothetical protein
MCTTSHNLSSAGIEPRFARLGKIEGADHVLNRAPPRSPAKRRSIALKFPPRERKIAGAGSRIRTDDLLITNPARNREFVIASQEKRAFDGPSQPSIFPRIWR